LIGPAAALLGIVIGSFLNVVIDRVPPECGRTRNDGPQHWELHLRHLGRA
jgi:hypothetical protein